MTDEEALRLKEGDTVEAYIAYDWRRCTVLKVQKRTLPYSGTPYVVVSVRRIDRTADGSRFPSQLRRVGDVRPARPADWRDAHVFADFLEDHGHTEAAALLRLAFPMTRAEVAP